MNLIHEPIIKSMLDDDLYKWTMQMAFMELFPNAVGEYRFNNRGSHRFNQDFLDTLNFQIQNVFPELRATDAEVEWFGKVCPFLKPWYLDTLRNFRYDPKGVECSLDEDSNLVWNAKGLVCEKMMWEVKMMATISEIYFKTIDTDWSMAGQADLARQKANELALNGCTFIDFGTRRRRNYTTQDIVVANMKDFVPANVKGGKCGFVGTSNVYLSHKHGLVPKGTQAHEWFMAMQALEGIRNSNYYALNNWVRVYNGDLGIALTDTLGTEQFLKNFGVRYSKLFDGVRWDSGDPYWYTDRIIAHYKSMKIDSSDKTIVYSNALDNKRAIEIQQYCEPLPIKTAYGIGTFFTNDFRKLSALNITSKALNMVIKLWAINGIPVVKTSDDVGKIMGDPDAIRVTRWMVNGTPLDN